MQAIEAILGRRTVPQVKMSAPGPSAAELRQLLAAAVAAPDHGKLEPWRFISVTGEARAKLGELMATALAAEDPSVGPAEQAKMRENPLRAPLIVIVAARLIPDHPKIPELEQICAAAAAAENILLAAHAMGYAAKWSSGKPIFSPGVKAGLGLSSTDQIIGFLYIGSYGAEHPAPARPGPEARWTEWTGEAAAS